MQLRTLHTEPKLAAKLAAELKDLGLRLSLDSTQMDAAVKEEETCIASAWEGQAQLLGSLQSKAKDLMASLGE